MTFQPINLGTGPNTGTGDKARIAFGKVNDNFVDAYSKISQTNVDLNALNSQFTTALTNYARLDGASFTGNVSFASLPTVDGTVFAAVSLSGQYADLFGKPVLKTVALSGSYNDLLDKPHIPNDQVNSDWNASDGVAKILNRPFTWDWSNLTSIPNFATVATSGSYDDLTGKPTTWDWTNLTSVPNFAIVAVSGSYTDLLNKPTLSLVSATGLYNDLLNKPTFANIAFSGSASDLVTGTLPLSVLPVGIAEGISFVTMWDASTNTPELKSGEGVKGKFYKVSRTGSTNIDGITQWNAGDMALFDGTVWGKIDGLSSEVMSVNGQIGNVVLTASNIGGMNAYALLSGSDFTGNVKFESGINLQGTKVVTFQNNVSSPRWTIAQTSASEIGSNQGSDFSIERYDDSGNPIDSPLNIVRATGRVAFSQYPIINGTVMATVSTSGSYNDLLNKPFIPTKVSDIANDSGYLTSVTFPVTSVNGHAGIVALTKADVGLSNVPNVDTTNAFNIVSGTLSTSVLPSSVVLSSQIALVAVTGSYADLLNKPFIPTKVSQIENDSGFLTSFTSPVSSVNGHVGIVTLVKSDVGLGNVPNVDVTNASNISSGTLSTARLPSGIAFTSSFATVATSGSYSDLSNKPFIPSLTSQLTNDAGFITAAEVQNPVLSVNGHTGLVVVLKSDVGLGNVPNTDATNANNITSGTLSDARLSANIVRVSDLSTTVVTAVNGAHGAITLTSSSVGLGNVPNVNTTNASNISSGTLPISVIPSGVALTSSLSSVAFTGSYNDLGNKPSIPSLTSQLTNDSGFITNTVYFMNFNIASSGVSGIGNNFKLNNVNRWYVGTDMNVDGFQITRYSNEGVSVDSPITISRSSGIASFTQTPYVGVNNIWHAGNFNPSNYALIGSGATFGGAISSPSIALTGANQTIRPIYFQTSGVNRWSLFANSNIETGLNSGSTLRLDSYDDNGNTLGNVFSVTRSSRILDFTLNPTVGGIQLVGIPSGGSSNQVLTKNSATNFDATWKDTGSGLPSVTTSDNGCTVMVVNGAWVKYLTPWQGPIQSSWNTPIM